MKYLCLVYGEEALMREQRDRHCVDYVEKLVASGHFIAGQALQAVETAINLIQRKPRRSGAA